MDLINQTPLPAASHVSQVGRTADGRPKKAGLVVAKATFKVDASHVDLDEETPLPIVEDEIPTELGFIPRDTLLRQPGGPIEVILLAAAYGRGGRPVEEQLVTLKVGSHTRSLLAVGDRYWIGSGQDAVPSPATPFTRLPLTWSGAFGGTSTVWVDPHSPIPVFDHRNRYGRGFDVGERAEQLARGIGAADGFPRWETRRPLPNVEDPHNRIASWDDAPEPVCWSSMPLDLGLRAMPVLEPLRNAPPEQWASVAKTHATPMGFAHPSWRLSSIEPDAQVHLSSCRPDGDWSFRLPRLEVAIHYEVGNRRAKLALPLVQLLLLPEEDRFTATYSSGFRLPLLAAHEPRSARLTIG